MVNASHLFAEQLISSNNNLDTKSIESQIKSISENLTEDEQVNQINTILMLNNEVSFNSFYSKMKNNWLLLKQKYNITESEIKIGVEGYYQTYRHALPCRDAATYLSCVAIVGVGAQLGYAGCVGTLFGAPICFGLVLIAQTAGIKVCHSEWCKPQH